MNDRLTKLHNDIARRGLADMLQYSELYGAAKDQLGENATEQEVVSALICVVRDLIVSGHAIVGPVVQEDGMLAVSAYSGDIKTVIAKFEASLRELGVPPDLGGDAWVELTEEGRAFAIGLGAE